MPNYLYLCNSCEKEFNIFHSFKEKCEKCPECNSKKIERLITACAISIKGHENPDKDRGYTGKHRELVNKLKNKSYRDGRRNEMKENAKLNDAIKNFAKMQEIGKTMTKEEKEKIKKEYGIDKNNIKVKGRNI
ncbi:MAG: zinc ribbon domain-containing protein [Nanoarchaeota archaeon]